VPDNYEQIRTALDRGFSVDNLRLVNRACLNAIQKGGISHPSVLFTVAIMAGWIADAWDDKPITSTTATRVENQVKPHLEVLLSMERADSGTVCKALDEAVQGFATALKATLDL
jgi:hypothetical protein